MKRQDAFWPAAIAAALCIPGAAAVAQSSTLKTVKLTPVWRIPLGNDYTSSIDPSERDAHAPFAATFYVASTPTDTSGTPLPGFVPLYRLLAGADHMDSLLVNEGGYALEGTLGYVWSEASTANGLSQVSRLYDRQGGSPHVGDHATGVLASTVPHSDLLPTYSPDAQLGYAYARFANTDQRFIGVSAGGILARSNVATGGAVWEWWWAGLQFLNDYDYGRQMQSAAYFNGYSLSEAGDEYGGSAINVDVRHPSPVALATTSANTQSTLAVPLEYFPERFGGGPGNPVIYPDATIGKNLTLNWIGPDQLDRSWPVAVYETHVNVPVPVVEAVVEAPTAYLDSTFHYYYQMTNFTTGATTPVATVPLQATNVSSGGLQAIILSSAASTSPNAAAMGVLISDPNAGFVIYDNTSGSSPGQYGSNFAKWEVHYDSGLAPGWKFKTWVVTDTYANVVADLIQLAKWQVSSR